MRISTVVLVATCLAVTVAPGSNAPVLSLMTPTRIALFACCACSATETKRSKTTENTFRGMCVFPRRNENSPCSGAFDVQKKRPGSVNLRAFDR